MANLKIERVDNSNSIELEKVVLNVLAETNLKLYAIIDKTFDAEGETDVFIHFYHFLDQLVKQGDIVMLHSGRGTNGITGPDLIRRLPRVYHYYWGSKSCVWNDKGDTAKLIRFKVIQSIAVPPVNPPQKLTLRFK